MKKKLTQTLNGGVTGAKEVALNMKCKNEPKEWSAVKALAVSNKMVPKRVCGGDSTASPKISKLFCEISVMLTWKPIVLHLNTMYF